jgi:GNAT superfamily N-acetyltransferase
VTILKCSADLQARLTKYKSIEIKLKTGRTGVLRPGVSKDAGDVTALIKKAFVYWTSNGVHVSPANQTIEQTLRHLPDLGFVLESSDRQVVGTFSLDFGRIDVASDGVLNFYEGTSGVIPFKHLESAKLNSKHVPSPCLIFKRLAVEPFLGRQGIGRALYNFAEGFARECRFDGMALETVKEAGWLYQWYRDLGFESIGEYRYPGSALSTILMTKSFFG